MFFKVMKQSTVSRLSSVKSLHLNVCGLNLMSVNFFGKTGPSTKFLIASGCASGTGSETVLMFF